MAFYGIPGDYLAVDYRPQKNRKCCWAAAIEKACSLFRQKVTQEEILDRYPMLHSGAKEWQISAIISTYMIERRIPAAWLNADMRDPTGLWWDQMEHRLALGVPVIGLILHPGKKQHAVVMAGVERHRTRGVQWYGSYDPDERFTTPIQIPKSYMQQYLQTAVIPYKTVN